MKYEKVNDNYYANDLSSRTFRIVEAEAVNIEELPEYDLFLHRPLERDRWGGRDDSDFWNVSEGRSGGIVTGATGKANAIEKAKNAILNYGKKNAEDKTNEAILENGLSPRYKCVSWDVNTISKKVTESVDYCERFAIQTLGELHGKHWNQWKKELIKQINEI